MIKYILPIFLISCGAKQESECNSEWFTTSGLTICDSNLNISLDEIDIAVDILEDDINSRPRYNRIELKNIFSNNNLRVSFTKKGLAAGCKVKNEIEGIYYCDIIASGLNFEGIDIYINYRDCLANTAFIHELLHSISYLYISVDIVEHNTPEFFIQASKTTEENNNCVERTVTTTLMKTLDSCAGYME